MAKRQAARSAPARLADVAREAGVGTTTVSRVLNGAHYVHPETLARIQEVIARLDYRPSHAARALKGERSHTLGLIVPSLRDSFFAELAHDVQNLAKAQGYVVLILASADEADRQIEELEILRSHRVDGAILVPPRIQTKKFLNAVMDLQVPTVALDRPLLRRSAFVACDNYEASFAATEHLIQHGNRKILFAGGDPALYTIKERERGYRDAMAKAGLAIDIVSSHIEPSMRRELRAHLRRGPRHRPDAIFASLNVATHAAISEVRSVQLSIPRDVALLGFDDFLNSELLSPAVTVIRQPMSAFGEAALRLLLKQISSGSLSTQQEILECEFIARASCGCTGATVASGAPVVA